MKIFMLWLACFLIDAAILQDVIPASTLTNNELYLMKMIILDGNKTHPGIGLKDIRMIKRFRSTIKNVLTQLDNAGRTMSLCWLYHYMVDTTRWFYSQSILNYK